MLRPIIALVTVFSLATAGFAQEDDQYGTYEDAETMRADQAIVRRLLESGGEGLQNGNWVRARESCGDLNEHLYSSPFMGEEANKAASAFSLPCYADAQVKLGHIESACRVYAQIDYHSLLDSIDPREVCRNSANPAPPSREEQILTAYNHIGDRLARMLELDTALKDIPLGDPARSAVIKDMSAVCGQFDTKIALYDDATSAMRYFCEGLVRQRQLDNAGACEPLRRSQAILERIGRPSPQSVPYTDHLDAIVRAIPNFLKEAGC